MQRSRTGGLLAVSGVAGVVAAHSVAYLIAVPDGSLRAQHLSATGHGYWPIAVGVACVAGLVAMVASGIRGRALALARSTTLSTGGPVWTAGLVAWQLVLFSVMEIGERVGTGSAPATLVRDPVFLVGLAIQVLVALLIVSVMRVIERGVELLVDALQRRLRQGHAGVPIWADRSWVVSSWVGGKPGARGPPASAFC